MIRSAQWFALREGSFHGIAPLFFRRNCNLEKICGETTYFTFCFMGDRERPTAPWFLPLFKVGNQGFKTGEFSSEMSETDPQFNSS